MKTINEYMEKYSGIAVIFEDEVFKVGDFKEFIVEKNYKGMFVFKDETSIKVHRTVMVGQYEGTFA